nr:pseudouridine synthase family protein [Tanacetum cinerariifolium]
PVHRLGRGISEILLRAKTRLAKSKLAALFLTKNQKLWLTD